MSKIIPLIKSCWHKVICALCALAVIFISVFSFVPVYASSVSAIIGGIATVSDFISVVAGLVDAGIITLNAPAEEYYVYWSEVAINGGMSLDQFEEYWSFVGTYGSDPSYYEQYPGLDQAYSAYVSTMNSSWNANYFISRTWNSDGSLKYSTDTEAGVGIDDNNRPTMTSSTLKDVYSDYASRYMPHPNEEEYIYSYQTCNGTKSKDSYFYKFVPEVPVYTYTSGTWGNKNWSDLYILPFYYDDDTGKGYYYSISYYRLYPSKSEDGATTYLNCDRYSLADNSLIDSNSKVWDVSSYPYLSCYPKTYFYVLEYTSSSNYYAGKSSNSLSFPVSSFQSVDYSTTITASNLSKSTTFTPDTNQADDWGCILSCNPFYLFANQTSINWNNIPDNYVITISGDTIYDYSITNPDTGDTSTINYYITNNYTLPDNSTDDPVDNGGSSSSGSTSGNVNVSGEVLVGGQIDIKADPIDINVNTQPIDLNVTVSSGGDSESYTGESVDISGYLDNLPEQSETMNDYFSVFFSFVPAEFLALLISGISIAILMRVLGR